MTDVQLEDPDIAILLALTAAITAGVATFVTASFRPIIKELGAKLPLTRPPMMELPELPEFPK